MCAARSWTAVRAASSGVGRSTQQVVQAAHRAPSAWENVRPGLSPGGLLQESERVVEAQCPTGDHQQRVVGRRRPGLVHPAEHVAVSPAERGVRVDAHADLVRHHDDRVSASVDGDLRGGGGQFVDLVVGPPGPHQVRHPQRQTVDDGEPSGGQVQRTGEVERLLDRRPVARLVAALEPVTLDPFRHLGVGELGLGTGSWVRSR